MKNEIDGKIRVQKGYLRVFEALPIVAAALIIAPGVLAGFILMLIYLPSRDFKFVLLGVVAILGSIILGVIEAIVIKVMQAPSLLTVRYLEKLLGETVDSDEEDEKISVGSDETAVAESEEKALQKKEAAKENGNENEFSLLLASGAITKAEYDEIMAKTGGSK